MDGDTKIFIIINLCKRYLSIEDYRNFRLVSRSFNDKYTPLANQTISIKSLIKLNTSTNLRKFGVFCKELLLLGKIYDKSPPWLEIVHKCPNVESLHVDIFSIERCGDFDQIMGKWPKIKNIAINAVPCVYINLDLLPDLKNVMFNRCYPENMKVFNPSQLIESINVDHYKIDLAFFKELVEFQPHLAKLKVTINRCDPLDFETFQGFIQVLSNYRHLQTLNLLLTIKDQISPQNIISVLQILPIIQLTHMDIQFYQIDTQQMQAYRMNRAISLDERRIEEMLTPIQLDSLFSMSCNRLTHLTLPRVDTDLMDSLLLNCSNLINLNFNSLLPIPEECKHLQFSRLRYLSFSGFHDNCIKQINIIHNLFPHLVSVYIKRPFRNRPKQFGSFNCHWIGYLFPKVGSVKTDLIPFNSSNPAEPVPTLAWHHLEIALLYAISLNWIKEILSAAPNLEVLKIHEVQRHGTSPAPYLERIMEWRPELEIVCLEENQGSQ